MDLRIFRAYMQLMDKLNVKPTVYAARMFEKSIKDGIVKI